MKPVFNKILANLLVLAVMLLPVPSAMSMPMQMSAPDMPDHCRQAKMDHDGHTMPAKDASSDSSEDAAVVCKCCGQCDGDCTGCTTMAAITLGLLQLTEIAIVESYTEAILAFRAHNTSPPSRPPLLL